MSTRVPLLACAVVLGFFAAINGSRPAHTLAYGLTVFLAVAWLWSWSVARRLRISRQSPTGVYMVGESFREQFTLRNGSLLPVAHCEVRDHTGLPGYVPGRVCSVAGFSSVTWTPRGTFTTRGRHYFGPIDAVITDPFGLFPRTVRLSPRTSVVVYPAIQALDDVAPLWMASGAINHRRGRSTDRPPEVVGVRDYNPHDGPSRIHWPSTARTGRLMSRTYDGWDGGDLLVVLDLDAAQRAGVAPESSTEYAISVAASLCHAALRQGQAVELVVNDAAHSVLSAGRGDVQRLRILDYLATVQPDGVSGLADTISRHCGGWRSRCGLAVITSARDSRWVEALLDIGVRGQRHLCVFVDPTSFEAGGEPFAVPAAWRVALDWWLIRRGDPIVAVTSNRAAVL